MTVAFIRRSTGHSEKLKFIWLFLLFFVSLPSITTKLFRLGKKRNKFLCFALDFS